jgi:ABC-type transport system involved in multi-copper enzyme maturation permease subunit
VAGKWFWLVPFVPLAWHAFVIVALLAGWRTTPYLPYDAQNRLIGMPLSVLAVGLGVRIIAGEIDSRTLEITYTVPGGAHRAWLAKLAAATMMLVVAEVLLAGSTALFLVGYPPGMLYVPLQAAVFYLVLSMALSALFKSEVAGALISIPALMFGLAVSTLRASPFFNTLLPSVTDRADPADILAWTVQNRIGYALVIAAVAAAAFGRAERREQMMSG